MLLPLDEKSRVKYLPFLKKEGVLVGGGNQGGRTLSMDFKSLSVEKAGDALFSNSAALGALAAVLGFEKDVVLAAVSDEFSGKPSDILGKNNKAAAAGFEHALEKCGGLCFEKVARGKVRPYLLSGSEACALGAWAAGCRFMAAYPMSPSTGIITFLSKHQKELQVFTEQAEDEIAAINMAVGASYAGVRAMTATSGGGFALMVETLSLSGMTETPVVVVLAQRPGPATGLPTRTEQGDLLFAIHSGHGEFPKIVLAPADAKDAFHAMTRAFDLSEKYQTPAILLTDQFLMDSVFTIEDFEIGRIRNRSHFSDPSKIKDYQRYSLTESGISPMIPPGCGGHLVCCDSDEHDEKGLITENLEIRNQMVEKRLRKGRALQSEIAPPEQYRIDGAETALVSWGSSRNPVAEAVDRLCEWGLKAGMVHFTEVWPLPLFPFPAVQSLISVEGNATGQLESLVRAQYGVSFKGSVRRYDGLPLDADFIVGRIDR
jgi:2-oxoglutarate ferredoxin oxidoreductase subunit alpha